MINTARATVAMSMLTALGLSSSPVRAADDNESLSTQSVTLNVETLAKLDNPWGMAFLPDGRLLITEKTGQLRVFADGKVSAPIKGLPKVEYKNQGGLLDVAIDPDFAKNELVYLSFTEVAEQQPKGAKVRTDPRLGKFVDPTDTVLKGTAVARGRLVGAELKDVTVIWRQEPKIVGLNHFGGRLAFAPDGKLFITSGDRQSFDPAQDLRTNLGKVVRINPDGTIPNDNPFASKSGARPDIWSFGHRNPLGAAINPTSGQLWIHEMGPEGGDEVNIIEAGKNYGWPVVSEGDNYDGTPIPRHATKPEFATPVRSWNPSISPSGLIFYDGDLLPTWRGNVLLGGLSSKSIFRLTVGDARVTDVEQINIDRRIRDVLQAADGAVLVLSDGDDGELLRLTPAGKVLDAG
jgi:glucose/arabinose dehydrogenase